MKQNRPKVLYVGKFDITSIDDACRHGDSPSQHIHGVPELRKHGYELMFVDVRSCRLAGKRDFQMQVLRIAHQADVILAHGLGEIKTLSLLRRLGLLRTPLVAFAHSFNPSFASCLVANGVDGLLALAQVGVRAINECGIQQPRVRYFPFGADVPFYRPHAVGGEHILSVGVSGRDYDTLLESAATVDAPFVFVGNLTQAQRSAATQNVKILSNTSYDLTFKQLLEQYDRAHFVVITHHGTAHPFGINAVVEAMAMAKAVILTDGPGIDIDPAGLGFGVKVAAHDPVALTAAIRKFLSEPERVREMGLRGRMLVESEYNTEKMGEHLNTAIRRVLA